MRGYLADRIRHVQYPTWDVGELSGTERAAYAAFLLASGRRYTVAQMAEICGITRQGAWYLLTAMSRVLPIYNDDKGRWGLVENGDEDIGA